MIWGISLDIKRIIQANYIRTITSVIVIILTLFSLTGCSIGQMAITVPELYDSYTSSIGTERLGRGDVEHMERFEGFVRASSDKLSFLPGNLQFGEYFVMTGDRVREGQVLATLFTPFLEMRVETIQNGIESMTNSSLLMLRNEEIEISILQTELNGLNASLSLMSGDAEGAASIASMAAFKQQDILRRQMLLSQRRETHALGVQLLTEMMEEYEQQIRDAVLRAPYDGVITWMADVNRGDTIEPYAGLIYISNETDIFVELSVEKYISRYLQLGKVIGRIGNDDYEMEWIEPSREELAYYNMNFMVPPARFRILNPGSETTPGRYVSVYLYYSVAYDVLRLPINCVYNDISIGTYVYVMENGQKTMRPFEQGLVGNVYVEVISGLEEGEIIYVKP